MSTPSKYLTRREALDAAEVYVPRGGYLYIWDLEDITLDGHWSLEELRQTLSDLEALQQLLAQSRSEDEGPPCENAAP